MDRDEILSNIEMLSHSQGFYGRLLNDIENADEAEVDAWLTTLENQHFSTVVDLVLYLES